MNKKAIQIGQGIGPEEVSAPSTPAVAWVLRNCKFAQVDIWEGPGGKKRSPASEAAEKMLGGPQPSPQVAKPSAPGMGIASLVAEVKNMMAGDDRWTPDAAIKAVLESHGFPEHEGFAEAIRKRLGQA
jgi:hypothetical protein